MTGYLKLFLPTKVGNTAWPMTISLACTHFLRSSDRVIFTSIKMDHDPDPDYDPDPDADPVESIQTTSHVKVDVQQMSKFKPCYGGWKLDEDLFARW